MTTQFAAIETYKSLSLFSSGEHAWICDNETGFSIPASKLFPNDWTTSVRRADLKSDVRFAEEMTGVEMSNYLSGIYSEFSDAAHAAKRAKLVEDNSRFVSQDETKEDWA